MSVWGIYGPLHDYLARQPASISLVALSFAAIEQIIERTLPRSARVHTRWRMNDAATHSHARAWMTAGWKSTALNLGNERITFVRTEDW